MQLHNVSAVVTGASLGIGQALAQALARRGARVALVGRNLDRLQQTHTAIQSAGGVAEAFITDLRDSRAIGQLTEAVQALWGPVEVLANIAGAWHNDETVYAGLLARRSVEEIDEVLDVNLRAPMLLCRQFIPGMIAKGRGKIINLSGFFPEKGPMHVHYYASKTAVEALTRGLANELRQYNIQVNCLSPGEVDTPAGRKFFPECRDKAISPEIVARLALFLLEDAAADYITGETMVVGYDGTYWNMDEIAARFNTV